MKIIGESDTSITLKQAIDFNNRWTSLCDKFDDLNQQVTRKWANETRGQPLVGTCNNSLDFNFQHTKPTKLSSGGQIQLLMNNAHIILCRSKNISRGSKA